MSLTFDPTLGITALHLAVATTELEAVQSLCENLDASDTFKFVNAASTGLCWTCGISVVKGETPLMTACVAGRGQNLMEPRMVSVLLGYGANPRLKYCNGK